MERLILEPPVLVATVQTFVQDGILEPEIRYTVVAQDTHPVIVWATMTDCNILALVVLTVIPLTIVLDGTLQPEIRYTAIKPDGLAVMMSAI
jgi:hypothetical protein